MSTDLWADRPLSKRTAGRRDDRERCQPPFQRKCQPPCEITAQNRAQPGRQWRLRRKKVPATFRGKVPATEVGAPGGFVIGTVVLILHFFRRRPRTVVTDWQ